MKLILACFAGMSTSIMMNKMKSAAEEKGIDLEISAVPLSELEDNLDGVEAVLIGPQIKYALPDVEKITEGKLPIMAIETVDYGMMNGEKVLNQAIDLLNK